MDAQATVLAAERAAPKVVAARKEELDLEQRMQLVFEQEEMQQEQEQQSAAREDQQEQSGEPASQKYEDGNACGGAPLEMVGATQQQAAGVHSPHSGRWKATPLAAAATSARQHTT